MCSFFEIVFFANLFFLKILFAARHLFFVKADDGYVSHNTQAPSVTSTITSNTSQESLLNLASAMQLQPEPCLPLSPPPPESAEVIEYVLKIHESKYLTKAEGIKDVRVRDE